jgi:hypothetical protein
MPSWITNVDSQLFILAPDVVSKDKDPPILQEELHLKQWSVFLHVSGMWYVKVE